MAIDIAASTSGMTPQEIAFEVQRGGRFVVYQYSVSILIVSFKRNSPVKFIKSGESATMKGMPFTLLSAAVGWWGIPWGFIYTPQVIYRNLKGGIDVTPLVLQHAQSSVSAPPARPFI